MLLAGLLGCSRSFYRLSADTETYPILEQRVTTPLAAIGRTDVMPAAGSRLYDPFDPDRPPQPPDDPTAHIHMDHPYRFKGWSHWGRDGQTGSLELGEWEQCLGLAPGQTLKLTQNRSLDVALLNSREYQTAVEDVYLTALSLTLNRFEFDVRWFGTNNTFYTHAAPNQANVSTDLLTSNSNVGFNKAFAAGGQLLVDFANSVVVNITGSGQTTVGSNILVTLSQPLLRNAGRGVRLESLTQAERDVLYAVRNFARFRKQFWADITTTSSGYLSLLLTIQNVRNQQANLRSQEQNYRLHQELIKGGRVSPVALDQVYQGFVLARVQVASAEVQLQNQQDAFKLRLGLPVRVPVELDDSLLNPFVLTDPQLEALRDRIDQFQKDRTATIDTPPPLEELQSHYQQLSEFSKTLNEQAEKVAGELTAWIKKSTVDSDANDAGRIEQARTDLQASLPQTRKELKTQQTELQKSLVENPKAALAEVLLRARKLLTVADELLAIQAQVRVYRIELVELDWDETAALAYARENRLDLQTAQAQATDAWRKVTVAANALRAGLTVNASANLGTDRDHNRPFNFAAEASSYTVGLQFDGPLNRLAERNVYRASLIQYHRARRTYMALADSIDQNLRRELRELKLARLSFETARQSLLSAARQLESAKIRVLSQEAQNSAGTSTLDILRAQDSLLNARNG
ncbi:MAG: TolC family protein, partial [Gemmataceae bacterium]